MPDNDTPTPAQVVGEGANMPDTAGPVPEQQKSEGKTEAELKKESQRLRNERNKARDETESLRKQLADLTAAKERAMEEDTQKMIQKLNEEKEQLARDLAKMKDLQSLTGKVRDPEAALKLLEDGHRGENGQIDVAKLLERYDFLAPTGTGVSPSGGGGINSLADPGDLRKVVGQGNNPAAINAAFDAALARSKKE